MTRTLSDEQVADMRRLWAAGLTKSVLARRFGVTNSAVGKVLKRTTK